MLNNSFKVLSLVGIVGFKVRWFESVVCILIVLLGYFLFLKTYIDGYVFILLFGGLDKLSV